MAARNPKPKTGDALRRTLAKIADGCTDLDAAAVARYAGGDLDHAEVARLARSPRPGHQQTARLRAAAMLASLDA